jgi:hypothetical protein
LTDLYFDTETRIPVCAKCGGKDFTRERGHLERQYLTFEDDGYVSVEAEDFDAHGDWQIVCQGCGRKSDDLDEALADLPEADYCATCGDVLPEESKPIGTDMCPACVEEYGAQEEYEEADASWTLVDAGYDLV